MAQALLHDRAADAPGEQRCYARVAKIVDEDGRDTRPRDRDAVPVVHNVSPGGPPRAMARGPLGPGGTRTTGHERRFVARVQAHRTRKERGPPLGAGPSDDLDSDG